MPKPTAFLVVLGAALLVSAALALSGCGSSTASPRLPTVLPRSAATSAGIPAPPLLQIRVVRLRHRLRTDAPMEDIWRLLGSAALSTEKQALWNANELRLGDGGRLAADRLNELATDTSEHTAQTSVLLLRENSDFYVSLGAERDSLDFLWTDAAGNLLGRHFDKCTPALRAICRIDPGDSAAVRVAIVPEIVYGPEAFRRVPNEAGGLAQQISRASFYMTDLAAEVPLGSGRFLAVGSRRASDLSVGGAFFYERRGPDLWVQTIVITAECVRADTKAGDATTSLLPGFVPEAPKPPPTPKNLPPVDKSLPTKVEPGKADVPKGAPTKADAPPAKAPAADSTSSAALRSPAPRP